MPRLVPASTLVPLLILALSLLQPTLSGAASQPAGYEGSRWWEEVEDVQGLVDAGKWRKALRRAEEVSEQVIRRSWQEPDLNRVLAALTVQRALAEAALGREVDARWHWHVALNLDPSVAKKDLTGYGENGELGQTLRAEPLRRRGRLPDGSLPPQTPMPGYRPPVDVPRPVCPFASDWSDQVRHLPVRIEVMVDGEGRLRQPIVLSETSHPVPTFWTLEALRTGSDIQPARLDGEPIPTLEEVLMEFGQPSRW